MWLLVQVILIAEAEIGEEFRVPSSIESQVCLQYLVLEVQFRILRTVALTLARSTVSITLQHPFQSDGRGKDWFTLHDFSTNRVLVGSNKSQSRLN